MEAISILDEISSDLGLVLWRSARNVLLWAETPASSRGELFAGQAGCGRMQLLGAVNAEPELRAPLLVIADLLARPGVADLLRVVNACRRIALWAEQRGALRTALEFTQAAALASPDSASLAFGVGRLARRLADYDRAESWYTRAAVQGRDSQDWRSYTSALAGIGNLHQQRGNFPAARRTHQRCLHAATRYHVRELIAAAYHNLFSVQVEMEAGHEVDELAARALAAYASASPGLIRLAYDVAFHWVLRGDYAGAMMIARALEGVVTETVVPPILQALIARAAAGLGDRAAYDDAAAKVDELLSSPAVPEEITSRTLLGLAHAALSIGEPRTAIAYAEEAISIAQRRTEGSVIIEADTVVEAASRAVEVSAGSAKARSGGVPPLAGEFVVALSRGEVLAAA